jgi:heme/copper-type cytochrome/quinol oxidase subunit 1
MLNYVNIAIGIYLVVSGGLFFYVRSLTEENIESQKRKLWFMLFFYFAACMFVIQLVVMSSNTF